MKIQGIYTFLQAALLLLFASCSQEETGGVTPLPDGKYPLQLTVEQAQPQTRTGGKDTWTGGEEIGVLLDGMTDAKKYVMDASGKAEPADAGNTIYWKNTAEASVQAWYPYRTDSPVNISDQSGGYADFDLLYATARGRYDQAINLRFNHRMAKVEVTLAAGDDITEEELDGATVKIYGVWEVKFIDGSVNPKESTYGEIKPYHDGATKKFEAVMAPQNTTGKVLIEIGIGGKTFTYTPDTDAVGKLEAGKRYAYTITVKAGGIDVQAVSSGTWSISNENVNVSSKEVKQSFTSDELKIGEYYYSDGTWSDGGLRRIYSDGSMEIATPKPAPMLNTESGASRTVIGIVFQTDPNRIGTAEKSKLGEGNVHGLVMAVKSISGVTTWGPNYAEVMTKCDSKKKNYDDISGYGNCEFIRNYYSHFINHPAFKAADDWNASDSEHKAPENTTGWFLPSSGQLWDIMQNLGGCPALARLDEQTSGTPNISMKWDKQGDVPATLNNWMIHIADKSKSLFREIDQLWTSSQYGDYDTSTWWVYSSGTVFCYKTFKNNGLSTIFVRPVLAF